jgi:hypothetical protein
MNNMKRVIISGFIAAIILSSCNKNDLNETKVWDYNPTSNALVKFLNSYTKLTPSLGVPANGPTIDYYINNVKMNATALGYGGLYPNISGGFAAAPSGNVTIKAVLNRPTGGGLPSDTIAKGEFLLGNNVAHSVILVDTLPNPTPFNPIMMVVQESVSMPAYGKFKIRLLNLVATTEMYELFNSTTGTVLTAPIPYKNLSDWIELPISTPTSVFQIRLAGTTTVMATAAALTGGNQRSYTFWARGNPTVSGRTRTLSSYISQ